MVNTTCVGCGQVDGSGEGICEACAGTKNLRVALRASVRTANGQQHEAGDVYRLTGWHTPGVARLQRVRDNRLLYTTVRCLMAVPPADKA